MDALQSETIRMKTSGPLPTSVMLSWTMLCRSIELIVMLPATSGLDEELPLVHTD